MVQGQRWQPAPACRTERGCQAAHPEPGHPETPKREKLASCGQEQVLAPCVQARMLASHRASGGAAQLPAAQPRPGRTGTSPNDSGYTGR